MADFSAELKKLLAASGCAFRRHGKGDHDIWHLGSVLSSRLPNQVADASITEASEEFERRQ